MRVRTTNMMINKHQTDILKAKKNRGSQTCLINLVKEMLGCIFELEKRIREHNYANEPEAVGHATNASALGGYDVVRKKGMVTIGPNQTKIKASVYNKIRWNCYSLTTRALMDAVFDKKTQATHNISGKRRLENNDYYTSLDARLDPDKIDDIVHIVRSKFDVSDQHVRRIISTKCSDTASIKRFQSIKNMLVCNNNNNVMESNKQH